MEELNLNSELLEPMRIRLEKTIDTLTKNALVTGKESEINLKIKIGITERYDEKTGKEWNEPEIEYQITDKIKEDKGSYKQSLGFNYEIELDEENNVIIKNKEEN